MDNTGLRGLFEASILQDRGRFTKEEKLKELALLEVELKGVESNRSTYNREGFNVFTNAVFSSIAIIIAMGIVGIENNVSKIIFISLIGIVIVAVMYALSVWKENKIQQERDKKFNLEKDEIYKLEIKIKVLKYLLFTEDAYTV